jgi:hypothetical protein
MASFGPWVRIERYTRDRLSSSKSSTSQRRLDEADIRQSTLVDPSEELAAIEKGFAADEFNSGLRVARNQMSRRQSRSQRLSRVKAPAAQVERQTRQEFVDQSRLTLSERLAFRAAIETGVSAALLRGLAHKR